MTFGRTAGILVGVGMMGTIIFGIWLAIHVELRALGRLDPRLAGALGDRGLGRRPGRARVRERAGRGPRGRNPVSDDQERAVLAILILMIWKPGA